MAYTIRLRDFLEHSCYLVTPLLVASTALTSMGVLCCLMIVDSPRLRWHQLKKSSNLGFKGLHDSPAGILGITNPAQKRKFEVICDLSGLKYGLKPFFRF